MDIKSFITLAPGGPNVIKLLMAVIYEFFNELVLVPGKPFKPGLTNTLA